MSQLPARNLLARTIIWLAAWTALLPGTVLLASPVSPTNVITVDPKAWEFNWASFDQEKIVSYGPYQYSVYWDSDAVLSVVRRDLRDNSIQILHLPEYHLTGNRKDGHRNTVVGISPEDGRLHLSFDHHCNDLRYLKSRKDFITSAPAVMTREDFESTQPLCADAPQRVTYPQFFNDPQGKLFLTYRTGGSGNGRSVLARYDGTSGTWKIISANLLGSEGVFPPWDNNPTRSAYLFDVLFDATGRLHMAWVYRETAASWASNHDLYYAYSDDGGKTWMNNDSKQIADTSKGESITILTPGLRVFEIPVYTWLMNQTSMALDSKNQPHLCTYKMPEVCRPPGKAGPTPPASALRNLAFYHYWRTPDGKWHESDPIRPPGGDGSTLRRSHIFLDEKDAIYMYWSSPEGFRCHVARAETGWKDWVTFLISDPQLGSPDGCKYDRGLLAGKHVLSFTADPDTSSTSRGFCIVDFNVADLAQAAKNTSPTLDDAQPSTTTVSSIAPIPADSSYSISLNGTWRFKLEQENGKSKRPDAFTTKYPIELPRTFEAFYLPTYAEGAKWHDLNVPGNWEMAGYSPATYYQPDNASGFYRKKFVVPESWRGRIVKVNFDGVQNAAEIWLNGHPVPVTESSWGRANYHESGWTAWQADLTQYVEFGKENLLALRVNKNARSTDLDTGDYFILGGIYRPVTLFSIPQTHIADFAVRTHLLGDGRAEVKTLISVAGPSPEKLKVLVNLEGEDAFAGTPDAQGHLELTKIVSNPRLWSAEFPNLYKTDIDLADSAGNPIERVSRQVGIREISIKDGLLLVNGTRVKLTGTCRHDCSASEGTAVGEELWTMDLKLMKEANINAIRCSHYPYGSGFYDLCDKMGFYVLHELPYCWVSPPMMPENYPGDDPEMTPAFEQRARETINRDKNHPCVIIWGIGNENNGKSNRNLQRAVDITGQMDPTRPRLVSHMPADRYGVELDDTHYPPLKQSREQANDKKRRAKWPQVYSEHPNVYDVRRGADYGSLDLWTAVITRSWDIIWDCDGIVGSFLWEWQDRAVADKCKTKLYDFDPATGVSYVKNKGLVDGWRNPRPDYYAVKMEYSPIKVQRDVDMASKPGTAILSIANKYSFTDLSHLKANWLLLKDGQSVAEGVGSPKLAPLSSGKVELPLSSNALEKSPDTLRVSFDDRRGWNVMTCQFELSKPKPFTVKGSPLPKALPFPEFNLVSEIKRPDGMRHLMTERSIASLRNVKLDPPNSTSTTLGDIASLDADIWLQTDPPAAVGHVRAQFADGVFRYHIDWTGPDTWIQELGWKFDMPNSCDHFSWKRDAIWSYYPDTNIGRPIGTATPDSANVHVTKIDRPDAFDFNSSKYNCQWASLTDAAGSGLCIQFEPKDQYAVRGGFGGNGSYTLVVNRQASPPHENDIVSDYFLQLKKGSSIDSSFTVGSNPNNPLRR